MHGSFPTKFFFKRLGAILKYIIKLPLTPFLSFYTIFQNTFVLYGVLKRGLIR
jgi:hypothetical protein